MRSSGIIETLQILNDRANFEEGIKFEVEVTQTSFRVSILDGDSVLAESVAKWHEADIDKWRDHGTLELYREQDEARAAIKLLVDVLFHGIDGLRKLRDTTERA